MIKKILGIRLWDDLKNPSRAWASNVVENGYEVLLVSQFTLYGHLKGHKPDYHLAMPPSDAKPYYENFVSQCQATYPGKVQSGVFGAYMEVSLTNDGPITMMLDSPVTTVPKHIQAKEAKAAKAAATEAASASAAVPVPEAEAETVTENKEK
jgi:D-tyrosyl-tRNA(Tyr) deacylase